MKRPIFLKLFFSYLLLILALSGVLVAYVFNTYTQHSIDTSTENLTKLCRSLEYPISPLLNKGLLDGMEKDTSVKGLVDEFGNLTDAIERAGRLGGIKGKVKAVYAEKTGFSLMRLLLGQEAEESLSNLSLPYPEPAFLPSWFR